MRAGWSVPVHGSPGWWWPGRSARPAPAPRYWLDNPPMRAALRRPQHEARCLSNPLKVIDEAPDVVLKLRRDPAARAKPKSQDHNRRADRVDDRVVPAWTSSNDSELSTRADSVWFIGTTTRSTPPALVTAFSSVLSLPAPCRPVADIGGSTAERCPPRHPWARTRHCAAPITAFENSRSTDPSMARLAPSRPWSREVKQWLSIDPVRQSGHVPDRPPELITLVDFVLRRTRETDARLVADSGLSCGRSPGRSGARVGFARVVLLDRVRNGCLCLV